MTAYSRSGRRQEFAVRRHNDFDGENHCPAFLPKDFGYELVNAL
jgi:hypothetical protein